jgi:general secretion pathway protein I
MKDPRSRRHRGFTLVEVLIAMVVAALGIGALLTTISSSADTLARLRDMSFAQWIALNQIAALRLSGSRPTVGVTQGSVDYAGGKWNWQQEVSDPGVDGILRVEVRVARQEPGKTMPTVRTDGKPMASVGSAYGFLSTLVTRPNGLTPDWSFPVAPQSGNPGGGKTPAKPQ